MPLFLSTVILTCAAFTFAQEPNDADAHYKRGIAWLDKGELDKAIADFTQAIRLDPKASDPYSDRGVAWYLKGEYDKAIADCSEAIRLNPKDEMAFGNRGLTWSCKGEYDKAIADYNKVICLDPENADAYNNLAWLLATCPLEAHRDGKKAIELATKACQLTEWKEVSFIDTLAATYAEAGDFDEAVKWQKNAMAMCPENQKDYCQSRLDLYKSGRPYREETKEN
jgi:tetratricopeptide (TPR) repeat protein